MKRLLIFLVIFPSIFLPVEASSKPGDIIKEVKLNISHPTGITCRNNHIWLADRKTDSFHLIHYPDPAIVKSVVSPAYFPSGLALHDGLLWSTDPGEGKIYATNPENGLTVKTLSSPSPSPSGIAWNGDQLWISDNRLDRIIRIDPEDGTTLQSFPAPAVDPRGITFGNGYLWCSDRIRDEIYMIDPHNGHVINIINSPGPFSWGLAWNQGRLYTTDYQDDSVYEILTRDCEKFITFDPRRARVQFFTEGVVLGPGKVVSLDVFYAIPSDRPNQKLLSPLEFHPEPSELVKDSWGQKVAVFHLEHLKNAQSIDISMTAELETSAIRYFIYPGEIDKEIPEEIKQKYLADDRKFDIHHPYIQDIVSRVAGKETNPYWKARKLYQYLISNVEYELIGGWDTAVTVLKRGTGSCSEYSFCYIALCRAAGVPARYVGSLVVRGDEASYDEVFHRWCEIYIPEYGWIPVDPNAGDKDLPADQALAFGGISNRFLITTTGGGGSEYIGWGYNYSHRWVKEDKCRVRMESIAEWEPIEKVD